MPNPTVQVATAFFVLLLTSKIFAGVYIYKDKDGVMTFTSVPCTSEQLQRGCARVEKVRQLEWNWDANYDGKLTISDVPGWFEWAAYYPGDWVIYELLKGRGRTAEFLELTPASYGGKLSLVFSLVVVSALTLVVGVGVGGILVIGEAIEQASSGEKRIGLLILLALGVPCAIFFIVYARQIDSGLPPPPAAWHYATGPINDKTDRELARLREEVIEKMKESRAAAEKLLAQHEEENKKLTIEYQRRRQLYSKGLIRRSELNQVERALAEAIVRVEEDKRWLMESDIAITEATMRHELLRSSKSPIR